MIWLTSPFRHWSRGNAIALAALLLSASLAGVAFRRALRVDPFPSSLATASVRAHASRIVRTAAPPEDELRSAIESDPFHPERRPPTEHYRLPGELAATDPLPDEASAPPVRLIGTVLLPRGGSFALCQWANESARIVRVGEQVAGLTLRSVEQGGAVFHTQDGRTLEVRVPKPGT